ncbi:hypothetical protein EWM64_g6906 [Hericium alpestre]|uniref:Uncharacterized protein n=1 Tax=Hericium alpestre TaxID=135208 RepID=A0A4Y9ZUD7_9AGAM|nr:hypothetical protein EWM64_g6906 [Hericium alpestre]
MASIALARAYQRSFDARPHVTLAVAGGALTALGDAVAQACQILLAFFLGSMGVMEGRDTQHIKVKFRDLYAKALITNWKVWPTTQFINFRFMPLSYRVPFQQTCGVFWTLYLSLLNAKEDAKQDQEDAMHRTLEGSHP